MLKQVQRSRRAAPFIFAVAVSALAARPCPAAELPPDLALVPPGATAVVTVRAGAVLEKLGLDLGRGPLAFLLELEKLVGLKVADIDRATFLTEGDPPTSATLFIVRMAKPFDPKRVGRHLGLPGELPAERSEKRVIYGIPSTAQSPTSFCIEGDRTLVFGNSDLLKAALAPREHGTQLLADVLAEADRHDLLALVAAMPNTKGEPARFSAHANGPPASHATDVAPEKPMAILGVPAPVGAEVLTLALDVGKETTVEARLNFADVPSANQAEPLVHFGLEVLRGQALMLTVMAGTEFLDPKLFGLPARDRHVMDRPTEAFLKVARGAEKCLQSATVRRQGRTIRVAVKSATDVRELRQAIQAISEFEGACWAQSCKDSSTGPVGMVFAPDRALRAPGANTPTPASGLPMATYLPTAPLYVPATPAPGGAGPVPTVSPASSTLPASTPAADLPMLRPGPAGTVKFAVANVKRDAALLFRQDEGGKLTFVRKVAAGEAVDVESRAGYRWYAIFADKPAGITFVPVRPDDVVLLR